MDLSVTIHPPYPTSSYYIDTQRDYKCKEADNQNLEQLQKFQQRPHAEKIQAFVHKHKHEITAREEDVEKDLEGIGPKHHAIIIDSSGSMTSTEHHHKAHHSEHHHHHAHFGKPLHEMTRFEIAEDIAMRVADTVIHFASGGVEIHILDDRNEATLNLHHEKEVKAVFKDKEPFGTTPLCDVFSRVLQNTY